MHMKDPPPSGRLDQDRDCKALGLNVSKAAEILKVPRDALRSFARQGCVEAENGATHRKGVRPDTDHLHMELAYDVAKYGNTRETFRPSDMSRPERANKRVKRTSG